MGLNPGFPCIMRTSCLALWVFLLTPKIILAVFKFRRIMKPAHYFLVLTCVFKILSDFILIICVMFGFQELAFASCGVFSIYFSLEATVHILYSDVSVFFHNYTEKFAGFIVSYMVVIYTALSAYLVAPELASYFLVLVILISYVFNRVRTHKLKSKIKKIAQQLERNEMNEESVLASSYISCLPLYDIFYLYNIGEILFFKYYPTDNYLMTVLCFYELYLFILMYKYVEEFLSSDRFYNNHHIHLIIEGFQSRLQILSVSVNRSLTMNIGNLVLIVTPGSHELYIGEPIEEYIIYI